MAILLEDKPNVDPPDSDYPYGKIRDDDGLENGTPLNQLVHQDFHQFFARLLAMSGIVANGLPDNDYSGFQYFEALQEIIRGEDWHTDLFTTNDDGILYKIDKSGFVEIYGNLNYVSCVVGTLTLPAGYRPAAPVSFSSGMAIHNDGTVTNAEFQIDISAAGVITTTPALHNVTSTKAPNLFINLKFKVQ